MTTVVADTTPTQRFSRWMDGALDQMVDVVEVFIKTLGLPALLFADVIVGGIVTQQMFVRDQGWSGIAISAVMSIALSLVSMFVWSYIITDFKWRKLPLALLPAVAISLVDAIMFDIRIVTLWLYDHNELINGGPIPPNPTYSWWGGEAAFFFLSLFLEPMIVAFRRWLRRDQ